MKVDKSFNWVLNYFPIFKLCLLAASSISSDRKYDTDPIKLIGKLV